MTEADTLREVAPFWGEDNRVCALRGWPSPPRGLFHGRKGGRYGNRREKTMTFDDFWADWPDKKNKASAAKAWAKLKPNERAKAATRAKDWCVQWRKDNPQAAHIHASTYINQKRFLDADEVSQANQAACDGVSKMQAQWIKDGKHFLFRSLSASRVAELVNGGFVTTEECRRAGAA